jgi:hypothetical protein
VVLETTMLEATDEHNTGHRRLEEHKKRAEKKNPTVYRMQLLELWTPPKVTLGEI